LPKEKEGKRGGKEKKEEAKKKEGRAPTKVSSSLLAALMAKLEADTNMVIADDSKLQGGGGSSPWGPRALAFTRLNISRCNYPIPVGFVLAWTSIHGLALRANSAGMKRFHPDIFHLVNGIMDWNRMITP